MGKMVAVRSYNELEIMEKVNILSKLDAIKGLTDELNRMFSVDLHVDTENIYVSDDLSYAMNPDLTDILQVSLSTFRRHPETDAYYANRVEWVLFKNIANRMVSSTANDPDCEVQKLYYHFSKIVETESIMTKYLPNTEMVRSLVVEDIFALYLMSILHKQKAEFDFDDAKNSFKTALDLSTEGISQENKWQGNLTDDLFMGRVYALTIFTNNMLKMIQADEEGSS